MGALGSPAGLLLGRVECAVDQLVVTQKQFRSLCDPVILPVCLSTRLLGFLSHGDGSYVCVLLLSAWGDTECSTEIAVEGLCGRCRRLSILKGASMCQGWDSITDPVIDFPSSHHLVF